MKYVKYVIALFGLAGLVVGNYIFQLFQTQPNWHKATEISGFQFVAVAVVMTHIFFFERNQDLVP
jgi:xanthosine utilization system XapX-like protein